MRAPVRVLAVISKELWEAVRQPRLLVVLVLGPFLILAVFGAGIRDTDPELRTAFVVPDDPELAEEVERFAGEQEGRLDVVDVTDDSEAALADLRGGAIELVIEFPPDVTGTVADGEHAIITLHHDQLDPVEAQAVELYMQAAISQINEQVLAEGVRDAQARGDDLGERVGAARDQFDAAVSAAEDGDTDDLVDAVADLRAETAAIALAAGPVSAALGPDSAATRARDLDDRIAAIDSADDLEAEAEAIADDLEALEATVEQLTSMDAAVVVAPFRGETVQASGTELELSDFYAPAVVVVLLQHLLITLGALSIVRERTLGTTELYRVAPLRVTELVIGKLAAYGLIGAAVAAVLVAAMVLGLGVPLAGDPLVLAGVLGAVMLASAGLGLCIAGVSATDSQAVQATMLVLLATIFLSGFVLSLERFVAPFSWIGWVLPPTYGIEIVRAIMLRGAPPDPWLLGGLIAYGVLLVIVGGWATGRRLRRAS